MINNWWWDALQSVTNKMKKTKIGEVDEPAKFKFEVAGKLGDLLDVHRKGGNDLSAYDQRVSKIYKRIPYSSE